MKKYRMLERVRDINNTTRTGKIVQARDLETHSLRDGNVVHDCLYTVVWDDERNVIDYRKADLLKPLEG